MPKRSHADRFDSRAARERLTRRREPHWRPVTNGDKSVHLSLGYRRTEAGRTGWWIARRYEKGTKTQYRRLGKADDVAFADGKSVLTFAQAEQRAREVFAPPGEYVMTTQDEISLALFIERERA